MDLSLTEQQTELKNRAREFLEKECPLTLVREMEEDNLGYPPELWKKMVDMGWMRLPFTKEYGGAGREFFDLALLTEEMGRILLPSPFIYTMIGGLTIMRFGREDQKTALLPSIGRGELIMSLALYEPNQKLDEDAMTTRAETSGDGFTLFGNKTFVPDLQAANKFLCVARSPKGVSVFLIDTGSSGMKQELLATLACDKQWDLSLEGVKVSQQDLLGEEGKGWEVVEWGLQCASCLLSAYMVGGAQMAMEMSLERAKTRVQFGRPVGTFQVCAHTLADMLTRIEMSRWLIYQAVWKVSEGLPADFEVAAAKAFASETFQMVAEKGLGIFGSYGTRLDWDIQLFYRTASFLKLYLGDAHFYQERVAQLMGI